MQHDEKKYAKKKFEGLQSDVTDEVRGRRGRGAGQREVVWHRHVRQCATFGHPDHLVLTRDTEGWIGRALDAVHRDNGCRPQRKKRRLRAGAAGHLRLSHGANRDCRRFSGQLCGTNSMRSPCARCRAADEGRSPFTFPSAVRRVQSHWHEPPHSEAVSRHDGQAGARLDEPHCSLTRLSGPRREHLTKELQAWNKAIQAKAKEGKLDLEMDPVRFRCEQARCHASKGPPFSFIAHPPRHR